MKTLLISIDLIMGARVLVNVLKSRNHEAKSLQIINIKYCDSFSEKALQNIYKASKGYDAVGLSFNSFYSLLAEQLGKYLKSKGLKWLITGGPHTTALPEETLSYADAAVIYEAEITLPKLLDRLSRSASLKDIKGIMFKGRDGSFINTGCPDVENNIDNIPPQSFSAEDITYYDVSTDDFAKPTIDTLFPHAGKSYFLMTSRGCPFNCTYCCNNLYAKLNRNFMKVRKRSIPSIISEMREAKKAGFDRFYIVDDNFLAFTMEEIENFSQLYKRHVALPFGLAGINPNNMRSKDSNKKIEVLLDCGLSDVRIGVQSGSDKTLKMFNRNYTAKEVPGLLTAFSNRSTVWDKPNDKLRVAVDFICDAPWETDKDKLATVKMANKLLPTYGVFFYTLVYLPGTDMYHLAVKEKWMKDRVKDIYMRGIAGVDDNIYNRLLFLVAVFKERSLIVPDEIIEHILKIYGKDYGLAYKFIDFLIETVNGIEEHHCFKTEHLTLHPYLKGFNKWEKTAGRIGKKVLFRSYHDPYG